MITTLIAGLAIAIIIWALIYFIVSIVLVFVSPKIVKSFFQGTSVVSTMVGAMLAGAAAGVLGGLGAGAAAGMLGNGFLANAAKSLGVGSPSGSGSAGLPGSNPAAGLTAAAGNATQGSAGAPLSEAARLATSMPDASQRSTGGAVSAKVRPSAPQSQSGSILDSRGQAMSDPSVVSGGRFAGFDTKNLNMSTPETNPLSAARSALSGSGGTGGTLSRIPSAFRAADAALTSGANNYANAAVNSRPMLAGSVASLQKNAGSIGRAGMEIAKHTAMAAGSGGSLGGYVQTHVAMSKGLRPQINPNAGADEQVPQPFGAN